MFPCFVKGSLPAIVGGAFACVALYNFLPLVLVFLVAVPIWFGFSAWRLTQELIKRSYKREAAPWDRENFSFWLGGLASVVLTPIVFFYAVNLALSPQREVFEKLGLIR